jgi:hypothetical protein
MNHYNAAAEGRRSEVNRALVEAAAHSVGMTLKKSIV